MGESECLTVVVFEIPNPVNPNQCDTGSNLVYWTPTQRETVTIDPTSRHRDR